MKDSLPVLAAVFLVNLGQGALRPSLPLYLQQVFGASYRRVTLIPVAFGLGRWLASLPTGFLLVRFGRARMMTWGLLVMAGCDVVSVLTLDYGVFLQIRLLAGVGWAMVSTVATIVMVDQGTAERRGGAISLLLMSETAGLLLGSVAGGWLYQGVGAASPFLFEAALLVVGMLALAWPRSLPEAPLPAERPAPRDRRRLTAVLRVPGVLLMSVTNAVLMAIQTGVIVFLFPLYLATQGRLRPVAVGYVVSLGVLGRLAGLWLGGRASDRRERIRVLIPGLVVHAAALAALPLVSHPIALAAWSVVTGAATGFVAGLPTAIVGDRVAPPSHGVAIGWLRTATDTGLLVGPLVMGELAEAMHLSAPFLFAAALLGLLAWLCRGQARPAQGRA